MKLLEQAERPMSLDYNNELDVASELEPDVITIYQELIGEL